MSALLLLLVFVGASNAANILGFFPAPSISHQLTYQPIWRELSLRGHQVTVITPNPLHDKSLTNLTEIDIHDVSYAIWAKHNISTLGVNEEVDSSDITPFLNCFFELMDSQLSQPAVKEIITNAKKQTFDLLMVEFMTPNTYPLQEVYKCPMIGVSSMPLPILGHDAIGNPSHPIVSPDMNLPFSRGLTFKERLTSFSFSFGMRYLSMSLRPKIQAILKTHYGNNIKNYYEAEASMVFANSNPALQVPRPNVPNFIDISGIHIKPEKPLPKDIKTFLDNAKEGVIYLSFGSNIKSKLMPPHKIKIILETLSELPYQILWKFESNDLPNKPDNVEIRKWLPQQDVLRHPNIKAFITQGGLQSWEEALYTKTPLIVIPFFGDQHGNARKIEEVGMGKSLKFSELNKEQFKATILEVINNDYYKERVNYLNRIALDQPMSGLEKAIWWTEFVIRHKGASHFRSPALDLPWYQYFMVDVIGLLLTILLIVLFITVKIIKFVGKPLLKCFKCKVKKN